MTTGSGCAFFDYDNDGWVDAFLVNNTNLDQDGQPKAEEATYHALFRNQKDGTFKNVTREAGIFRPPMVKDALWVTSMGMVTSTFT